MAASSRGKPACVVDLEDHIEKRAGVRFTALPRQRPRAELMEKSTRSQPAAASGDARASKAASPVAASRQGGPSMPDRASRAMNRSIRVKGSRTAPRRAPGAVGKACRRDAIEPRREAEKIDDGGVGLVPPRLISRTASPTDPPESAASASADAASAPAATSASARSSRCQGARRNSRQRDRIVGEADG